MSDRFLAILLIVVYILGCWTGFMVNRLTWLDYKIYAECIKYNFKEVCFQKYLVD